MSILYRKDPGLGVSPQPGAAVALSVAVLATGGTIATRTDESGTAVARTSGPELLGDLALPAGVAVDAEDVFRVGSYAMTLQTCNSSPSASTSLPATPAATERPFGRSPRRVRGASSYRRPARATRTRRSATRSRSSPSAAWSS